MFGLFKRTKVESWETALLINIFEKLGKSHSRYQSQVEEGLLVKVRIYNNNINYVGFSYNPAISKKYEVASEVLVNLKGIRVFDKGINEFVDFELYINRGLIAGYSTPSINKFQPDVNMADIQQFQKDNVSNSEFTNIAHIFTSEELEKINPSEIYEVEIEGRKYFHLKDLEDGDFISFDLNKKVFKITHDPLQVIEVKKTITEAL